MLGLLCKTSRKYNSGRRVGYWFDVHSTRYTILSSVHEAWVAFGCGSPEATILIPYAKFLEWTDGLNITRKKNGEFFWHVHIQESNGRFQLRRKKGLQPVDLMPYLL